MAIKFLDNLDLNGNQLLNSRLEVLASDPEKDEILISDSASSNPKLKTKTTNIIALSKIINLKSTFVFHQAVPSDTWVIEHNLNKFPSVTVVNSHKEEVIGSLQYNTTNKLTLTFSAPFSGDAYIN